MTTTADVRPAIDWPAEINDRGVRRRESGDLAGALADFGFALALKPDHAEALHNRALTWLALGDPVAAAEDLDVALQSPPPPHLAAVCRHSRARLRVAARDFTGALEDLDDAVQDEPLCAELYQDRGNVRQAMGDFAGAVEDHDWAIAVDPLFCAAYLSRANAHCHLRDSHGASADYLAALHLDPALATSQILLTCGDAEAVLDDCRERVRTDPDDLVAYVRRGLALRLLGRDEEAEADFARVLRLCPRWREPLARLAEAANARR